MKTNTLQSAGWGLIILLTICMTSCEIELDHHFYDDDNISNAYYARSAELCSRTWIDFYWDMDGNYCRQELDFYLDRTGVDYIVVEYPNGYTERMEYRFRWNWDDYAQNSIRMNYGGGDVSYLDDVYLGRNRLSGYLDGRNNYVEYQGY